MMGSTMATASVKLIFYESVSTLVPLSVSALMFVLMPESMRLLVLLFVFVSVSLFQSRSQELTSGGAEEI